MDTHCTKQDLDPLLMPKHVAIIMQGSSHWAKQHSKPLAEAYDRRFAIVNDVMKMQAELGIPVVSLYLVPEVQKGQNDFSKLMTKLDSLCDFLQKLKTSETIHKNGIKISVFGRWYDLPGRIVDAIKDITTETKDYDSFFLNLFINYNGQQEIVDAVRIISRKVKAGKLDPDLINREMIKEDIYTSYFMPPELIIRTGNHNRLRCFLLWDSFDSTIYFSRKLWPEFNCDDLLGALEYYQGFIKKDKK